MSESAVGTLPPPGPPLYYIADILNESAALVPDLPVYSPNRLRASVLRIGSARQHEPKEFHYELKSRGKLFAVLTIIAVGPYSKAIPTFVEGVPVKGRVRLMLDKPDTIQSVVVSITARLITGANQGEQLTFLNISRTLWSQSEGEPRNIGPDEGDSSAGGTASAAPSAPPKFVGKLQGDYTWHFSIDLPKEVTLPSGTRNPSQAFNLPLTFNERYSRASINYELSVRFVRGKLRTDHLIPAAIGYLPLAYPPPFSSLRLLAYQEGSPLVGPAVDPEGWFSTGPVQVQGKIFNARSIQVLCTLFIANPLCYTRGSVIPLYLRLESVDGQALDLLSTPNAIVLRLKRRTKYHLNADKLDSLAWKDAIDYSQPAVWWPSTEGWDEGSNHIKFLNGELHLRSDIKPTSAIAQFRIEYSVVLFPFNIAGLVSAETDPLVEYPVEIVTSYAPGPRPRTFSPPGYESETAIIAPSSTFSLTGVSFL